MWLFLLGSEWCIKHVLFLAQSLIHMLLHLFLAQLYPFRLLHSRFLYRYHVKDDDGDEVIPVTSGLLIPVFLSCDKQHCMHPKYKCAHILNLSFWECMYKRNKNDPIYPALPKLVHKEKVCVGKQ